VLQDLPRTEVVEAFTDADIFLFGSRVECSPLVMFEAFASKTLFVTTDCGNVRDYGDIVCIVESADEATAIIREYTERPGRFAERIERGYAAFRERLNWESIARHYEELYISLLR
jgi:L-malate glycosyltransferase